MIVAKNDEVKRSRLWRIALLVSSVLIVLVVIFLLTKLFTTNPLEGSWEDENGKISLSVEPDGLPPCHRFRGRDRTGDPGADEVYHRPGREDRYH